MAATKAAGRPPADVFLPAPQGGGSGGGGGQIMGVSRTTFFVLAGAAAVAAFLLWRHFRNQQAGQSDNQAATSADSTGIDPATGLSGGGGVGSGDTSGATSTDQTDRLQSSIDALSQAIAGLSTPSTSGSTAPSQGIPQTTPQMLAANPLPAGASTQQALSTLAGMPPGSYAFSYGLTPSGAPVAGAQPLPNPVDIASSIGGLHLTAGAPASASATSSRLHHAVAAKQLPVKVPLR